MPRRFYITEAQIRMIKEREKCEKLSKTLQSYIIDNDTFPIETTSTLVKKGVRKLLTQGYDEAVSAFKDDITQHSEREIIEKLSKLIVETQKKEMGVSGQLEKLCHEITEGVVKDVQKITCTLVREIPETQMFRIEPDTDSVNGVERLDDMDRLYDCANKRRIINMLTMGCAMTIAEQKMGERMRDIFEIDETLPHLYSKILKINQYLTYVSERKIDYANHYQSGYAKVTVGDGNATVEAFGTIFPFLLTESIRGAIECRLTLEAMKTEQNLEDVTLLSDILEDEPVQMTLGKTLWGKIDSLEDDTLAVKLLERIAQEKPSDIISLINEYVAGTKYGEREMGEIVNEVRREAEYGEFEKRLNDKESRNREFIEDDFTPEELRYNNNIQQWSNGETEI